MCYEHVLDCIMLYAYCRLSQPLHVWDQGLHAILIRKATKLCAQSRNVLQILFCAVDFSPQKRAKHGHSLLARRATLEYPAFTLITSGTVERGDVFFSLYQKGRGTDTVLSQVQSLGLRTKSLNISDLRKTLSFRKYLSSSRKRTATYCNVLLQKNGAWHGPSDSGLHAMLSKLAIHHRNWVNKLSNNFSWRETCEASNKGTCGAGETPLLKLHYQTRWSDYTAVCDDQPPPTLIYNWLACSNCNEPAGWLRLVYCSSSRISVDIWTGLWRITNHQTFNCKMSLYRPCTESDVSNSTHFSVVLFHYRMQSITWELEPKW